jgi:hypothetical protein
MTTMTDDVNELREAIEAKDYEKVQRLCDSIKDEHGPLVVQVSHDDSPEDPNESDGWRLYSFSNRHGSFKDPDEFADDDELQAKLKIGLAFPLSYYEHGNCVWSLGGQGPSCRWDSVRHAGFLIWEQDEENLGATTLEERAKDASAFLERYTAWSNGEVYGFEVVNGEAGCWGYYGNDLDYMFECIKDEVGDRPVKWTGSAAHLVDYHWKA